MNSFSCCDNKTLESKKISTVSSILKLAGEESRLKLLCVLQKNDHCVCEMEEHFDMSQSLISHHLRDLRDAGLIKSKKKGVRVYYSLTKKGQDLTNILLTDIKKVIK